MRDSSSTPERPEVFVDFEFDSGLLYIVVANASDRPARSVQCRFDREFRGLGGTTEMTRLPLLRNIEFLAPYKEVRTLLDSSAAYFGRKEPTKLAVTVTYRDDEGGRHERRIVHDLRIYRDVAYAVQNTSQR